MSIFTRRSKANFHPDHKEPQSPFYVPAELREDYANVEMTMAKVARHLDAALAQRADAAQVEADSAAGQAKPKFGSAAHTRKAVTEAGIVDADAEVAAHLAALAEATAIKAMRDAEAERQRQRHEARCRCCGALDVHTQPVAIELGARGPGQARHPVGKPSLVTIPGGRVCGLCDTLIRHQWTAQLAAQTTPGGTTYGEHVGAFLRP